MTSVSAFACLAEVVVIIIICPNFLRLHVSLGIHGVACVVLQRALHLRRYSSLPRVSLHSASFQFHSFPVWHDFVGGRTVVFAKIVRQPHLDRSRYSSAQIVFHAVQCHSKVKRFTRLGSQVSSTTHRLKAAIKFSNQTSVVPNICRLFPFIR